ncbi:EamA family transporter [Flavobacterium rhizosphaerae]|uniref:DMT family transporter n=1 Tax=Flavobacterium rhizosphaerae TaxID=3163298 RepID=A0ABW8YRT7_9FLAO
MENKDFIKGAVLVGLGAASYGLLATFVKKAYSDGYTTAEITASQILLGIIGVASLYIFQKNKNAVPTPASTSKNKIQLLIAGTTIGFTSVFYYLSLQYVSVSVGIVLLMQSVWMGVIAEWFSTKKFPGIKKLLAVGIVIGGTLLATNLTGQEQMVSLQGVAWGLLAAASYTGTMYAGNRIAVNLTASLRSLYMLLGGAAVVLAFTAITWPGSFNYDIFLSWGIPLAIFGTILPPVLMNAGFPKITIGLGSIIAALELPVSVIMAFFILNEKVLGLQWLGIAIILSAIVLLNMGRKKQ